MTIRYGEAKDTFDMAFKEIDGLEVECQTIYNLKLQVVTML